MIRYAYQPTILKDGSINYYGLGWSIDPDDPNHASHNGELEGFRTLFDRRLDNGKVIILLSNNSSEVISEIANKIWELWAEQ